MKTLVDLVYDDLDNQIKAVDSRVDELSIHSERSETSGGHSSGTLASAPLAADGAKGGDQYFVTNGRKVGEGVGAGTGAMCYYNPSTDSWFNGASDTAVLI